jgi:hypothetical protein
MAYGTLERVALEVAHLLSKAGVAPEQGPRIVVMLEMPADLYALTNQLMYETRDPLDARVLSGPHRLPRGIYFEATYCGVQFTLVDAEGFAKLTPYKERPEWPLLKKST